MPTSSPSAVLLGVQEPRLLARPRAARYAGHKEAVELAEGTGLLLDEWQECTLDVWMGESSDGWAATECGLEVPRQNGKGGDLEVVGLDSLFVSRLPLMVWTAHLFKTALEAFMRLRALIQSDPVLDAKVESYYQSNQRLAIVLKHSGPRIEFVARSKGSGRGLSGQRVVLDEAMFLDDPMMGALFPTMAAQSMNADLPQIFYTGSAPMADSTVWHRVRRRAMAGGDEGLGFLEWSVDPDSYDADSAADWARANPALGIRISEDYIRRERRALSDGEFARERLGIADPEPVVSDAELVLDVEAWKACFDGRSKIAADRTFGLDVSPDGEWASVGAAGARKDGLLHVETIDHAPNGEWIIDRLARLCERWEAKAFVDPSSGAGSLIPDLVSAGVKVVSLTRRDVTGACGRFQRLVKDGQLRHLGSSDLAAAVGSARGRRVGGAFVWDKQSLSGPDLSSLYAVTLAAWPRMPDETSKSPSVAGDIDGEVYERELAMIAEEEQRALDLLDR